MPIVGLRDLSRNTREVVEQLEQDGEPVVVTRRGKPIAMLKSVSEDQTAALALAAVPGLRASRDRAAEEIEAGEGEPATALLAEFEAEDGEKEETEAVKIEIPDWLTQQLVDTAIEGHAAVMSSRERAILNEYVSTLVENSVHSVVERARNVNSNLLAEAGSDSDAVVERVYVRKVRGLADAERLTRRPVEVEVDIK